MDLESFYNSILNIGNKDKYNNEQSISNFFFSSADRRNMRATGYHRSINAERGGTTFSGT